MAVSFEKAECYESRLGWVHPRASSYDGYACADVFTEPNHEGRCIGVLVVSLDGNVYLQHEGDVWQCMPTLASEESAKLLKEKASSKERCIIDKRINFKYKMEIPHNRKGNPDV